MEIDDSATDSLGSPFDFLDQNDVQSHFADLNIDLLRGSHIQQDDFYSFRVLSKYFDQIAHYYQRIYQLELIRDRMDGAIYFYLELPEEGKGKISDASRHQELTEENTVIGIMLLYMYYERYFIDPKEIHWADIVKEIMESDNRDLYKKMFFNDIRTDYSDVELEGIRKLFRKAIRDFNRLGWVKRLAREDSDDIHFVIKPAIHRLAKLYKTEIEEFEKFSEVFSFKTE